MFSASWSLLWDPPCNMSFSQLDSSTLSGWVSETDGSLVDLH